MKFTVELTTRAQKDLNKCNVDSKKLVLNESLNLEENPFTYKNNIKRIKGLKFLCYRLRINIQDDSIRLFYGIYKNIIFILRIVTKKDADKIIKSLNKFNFFPQ